jgi:hypothetical protein
MSDIQSISNGTYVIGQTSATNFVGGPGIKVDSPSEGTVRISNDETVLYEDWSKVDQLAGTVFNLSESWKNFERIGITYDNMEFTGRLGYTEYPTSGQLTFRPPLTNFNDGLSINIPWARWEPSGNNIYVKSRGLLYDSWTHPQATSGSFRGYRLHKIVGINRISGGNA